MTPESFTYWLQGFVELSDTDTISEKQWLVIKDHLKLVFDKKTPDRAEYKNPSYEQIIDVLRPKPIDDVNKQFEWMHERGPVKLSDLMTKEYGNLPDAVC